MRVRLIVGNWKMNGGLAANASLLSRLVKGWSGSASRELAVCVPSPYLAQTQAALEGSAIAWGAQDVSEHASGAFTGEVSAAMVAEFGCRFAIVGHSERRRLHGESDGLVAAKAAAALDTGLTPIACVGEVLAERERGETARVVTGQIDALIRSLDRRIEDCVVAYEPVWAIGTGRTATPDEAEEVHALLRNRLASAGAGSATLLYGGSVKAANAAALLSMRNIDGALVGGASLDADEFLGIARA